MVFKLKYVGLLFIGIVVLPIYANSFVDKLVGVDGISIGGGPESNSEADMQSYRLSVLWDWHQDWLKSSNWLLSGYFDLSFFYWENELNHQDGLSSTGRGSTAGISFSPVFRIKPKKPFGDWFSPYFEVGIGVSYVTHDEIVAKGNSPVDLGTNFQLEDRVGVGLLFGQQQTVEFGYRYLHYSNGGVNGDNDGIDFQQLHLTVWF